MRKIFTTLTIVVFTLALNSCVVNAIAKAPFKIAGGVVKGASAIGKGIGHVAPNRNEE